MVLIRPVAGLGSVCPSHVHEFLWVEHLPVAPDGAQKALAMSASALEVRAHAWSVPELSVTTLMRGLFVSPSSHLVSMSPAGRGSLVAE